ncbi:hypothetical protein BABINDRAFT_167081 [Babjeviella inositovora NRRL Y-12698]|uniref:K Homology domain-containing protein n=1 Tax=Babjeviella inositovora NRRL Y-12698 TaxID=984486 RepID=A0A1E3QST3_9ASCO|nr:uncharacterized protein BABINDRAFT_167081 [Babjeviella inositovora NRRL Y-12698]ODQ79977.1 hypothetical protein BABINDRAFT_167081 [Babjeviella inositovora NRRL Y-12698]
MLKPSLRVVNLPYCRFSTKTCKQHRLLGIPKAVIPQELPVLPEMLTTLTKSPWISTISKNCHVRITPLADRLLFSPMKDESAATITHAVSEVEKIIQSVTNHRQEVSIPLEYLRLVFRNIRTVFSNTPDISIQAGALCNASNTTELVVSHPDSIQVSRAIVKLLAFIAKLSQNTMTTSPIPAVIGHTVLSPNSSAIRRLSDNRILVHFNDAPGLCLYTLTSYEYGIVSAKFLELSSLIERYTIHSAEIEIDDSAYKSLQKRSVFSRLESEFKVTLRGDGLPHTRMLIVHIVGDKEGISETVSQRIKDLSTLMEIISPRIPLPSINVARALSGFYGYRLSDIMNDTGTCITLCQKPTTCLRETSEQPFSLSEILVTGNSIERIEKASSLISQLITALALNGKTIQLQLPIVHKLVGPGGAHINNMQIQTNTSVQLLHVISHQNETEAYITGESPENVADCILLINHQLSNLTAYSQEFPIPEGFAWWLRKAENAHILQTNRDENDSIVFVDKNLAKRIKNRHRLLIQAPTKAQFDNSYAQVNRYLKRFYDNTRSISVDRELFQKCFPMKTRVQKDEFRAIVRDTATSITIIKEKNANDLVLKFDSIDKAGIHEAISKIEFKLDVGKITMDNDASR